MELTAGQVAAFIGERWRVMRAVTLLRSVSPDSFHAGEQVKQLCEQAGNRRGGRLALADVVSGLAGLLRCGPLLGPGSQEVLETCLAPVIEKMGLAGAVGRAVAAPGECCANGRGRQ